jgi:outer membrane protein
VWLLGASLTTAAGTVHGESLGDAWALALRQDAVLAATRNQAEAAELGAQAARGQRWPTISITGGYTKLDDSPALDFSWSGLPIRPPPLFEDDAFATGAATVTLPLYASGQISSSIAAAEAQSRGASAQLQVATGDLKLAIAEAYVEVLRTRKAHAVAQSSVRTHDALLRDTESMFERELVPKNELLAAQVALADAKQNALRASNAADVALAAYNRRLGAPLDRPVDLDESISAPGDLPTSLETLTEQALARRPELSAFDAQVETYGQMARAERSRVLPQVVLTAGYQYLENQFLDDQTVGLAGIGVRWALFDGGQSRKRAAALEHTRQATEHLRTDARSLVQLQVRQAWLGLREARLRGEVTADAADQAEESLRIARERYTAGLGTQTQLLEAETSRVRAQQNRDAARLDAQLAELRLARAAGAL